MAQIFEDGQVNAHIPNGSKEPAAHCYDKRDESFATVVVIDIFTFLPVGYGEEHEDNQVPSWRFVVEAIHACVKHEQELWSAWEAIKDDPLF